MKVLIVEDEIIAADKLKALLERIEPSAHVVSITASIDESIQWFQHNCMPDLVLMDINLADGSCFSIFDIIDVTAPIIFCTAYDEYALKAFQSNGIAYLLKPVLEADLRGALEKLATLQASLSDNASSNRPILKTIGNFHGKYKTRFLIKTGDKLLPIPVNDVACFMAQEHGVKLFMTSGESYFLDYTVTELEGLLDPANFFRINRQAIVSGDKIESATANIRHTKIVLSCMPQELAVARERARAFREWFDT